MDYRKIYLALIERARTRTISNDEYFETHHIIPRCLGGSNSLDNLVELTPEEHYLAHQLLVKIHPTNNKLVHAANMMCTKRPTNKLYGWLRRRMSVDMKTNNPNRGGNSRREYNKKHGSPNIGYKHSSENREKMRLNKLGILNPNANGNARRTKTFLINVETGKVYEYDSLSDAEKDKQVNHASVHYNRKRERPHKGFYWCVGADEYMRIKEIKFNDNTT